MRITFAASYDKTIHNLNCKKSELDKLSTMLSSGKRLLSASDDPVAWAQVLNMKQTLRELETYDRNIHFAVSWHQATEAALNKMSELLMRAKEVAIRAIKPTSPAERTVNSSEMEQILGQALQTANSQCNGLYIFSGWFADDGTLAAAAPPFDGNSHYAYQGNERGLMVRTSGTGENERVNLDGKDVFFIGGDAEEGTNIFEMLEDLKDAIAEERVVDIENSLTLLDRAYEHITSRQAVVGVRLERLERRREALADLNITAQSRYADISEADYLEVISQLQQKQTVFQAALKVTSMLDGLNLLNYLR